MTFPVVLLRIYGVLFAAFGIGFAIIPERLSEILFDSVPSTASAVIDMRATYGGVAFGIGVFFLMCASRPPWLRAGLVAGVLVLASLAVARLVGVVADGDPNAFILLFLALEVAATALTAVALGRPGHATEQPRPDYSRTTGR